jgi:FAD/FMN-containing dehydrogenase
MTPAQTALIEHVRAALGNKAVVTDPGDIAPWLTDWRGRFVGASPAILAPDTAAGMQLVVAKARELGIALVPQGGNTSMVGGATPPRDGSALILSTRRLNHIRSLRPADGLAVAEAGVILSSLHDAALAEGMRFPLTLGAKGSATIGGLASTNAGGTQVLRFGTMRGLVAGVEAVLPDGSLHDGLAALKKDNRGYDLNQLLIGAEGTIGVITAATLRLVPAILDRAVAWVGLADPERALALLRRLQAGTQAVESFEIVPQSFLNAVVAHVPATRPPLVGDHRWHVLIEATRAAPGDELPAAVLERLIGDALAAGEAEDAVVAASEAQADALWKIRETIPEASRAEGPALQHDISVPVAGMPRFLTEGAATVEARFPGTRAAGFGHLGDGNVHFHVRAPAGVDAAAWYAGEGHAISAFVHDLVVAAGGSISAEHGIGQLKRDELARLSSPARMTALRAIKRAFDPGELMNPGKLVTLAPGAPTP